MELVKLTVQQLVLMFLYLSVGYCLFRFHVVTADGSREIAGMLVKLVIPAVIVNSFCVEYTPEKLRTLGVCTLISAALLALAIAVGRLVFPKRPIDNFAAAFSNAGFMGIPLVQAVLGQEAVFYIAPFVALLNFLQWTYGVDVIREERSRPSVKKLLWNPLALSLILGILLFVTRLGDRVPQILRTSVSGIGGLNTPLAMIILGVYLAREDLKKIFSEPGLYLLCAIRLILIPLLSLALLWVLPLERGPALALLITAAAPVGANVAVYAQLHGRDYSYASRTVVLSTLLSLLTLPLTTALAQRVL